MNIRKPAVAGMFYPREKEELQNMINRFLANVPDKEFEGSPKAIIVPHAGLVYSGQVAAYAYALLKKNSDTWKRIIILGPAHRVYLTGIAADPHDIWETPLGTVVIAKNAYPKNEAAHTEEHCLEMQLPFIQTVLPHCEIIPLLAGDADPVEAAKQIGQEMRNDTLLVISSDLSHFKTYDEAIRRDTKTDNAIAALDYDAMAGVGDACGKIPILVAIDLAKRLSWQCKQLHYATSGDVSGDMNRVVGYASFVLY